MAPQCRAHLMRASTCAVFAIAMLLLGAAHAHAASRRVVIEFAGDSSGVTPQGDAWVTTTGSPACDAGSVAEASCGIDFTNDTDADADTTGPIRLGTGFGVRIGDTLYDSLFVNRYGYVTFGSAPASGAFTFYGSLAAMQAALTAGGSVTRPFIAPFQANLQGVVDNAAGSFVPFGGGAAYFRGKGDPLEPFAAAATVPAFAVTWINGQDSVATQLVIYKDGNAGDFYLTLRYGQADPESYDISATSSLPAVAGFALTTQAADQVELAGPLPDATGYLYHFVNGHLATIVVDSDGDGVADGADNCPNTANGNQLDSDHDGVGDACDNCPSTANADQADANHNGVGNACEPPPPARCDVDRDRDVDLFDINAILRALGRRASGATDPRDADGNLRITLVDAVKCTAKCTRRRCAAR